MGQVDHENELLKFIHLGDNAVVLIALERSQFFSGECFMFVESFVDDVRVYLWFFNNLLRSRTQLIVGRFIGSFPVVAVQLDEFIHPLSFHKDSILIVVAFEDFCTFDTAVFVSIHHLPSLGFGSCDIPPDGLFGSRFFEVNNSIVFYGIGVKVNAAFVNEI